MLCTYSGRDLKSTPNNRAERISHRTIATNILLDKVDMPLLIR